MEFLVRLICEPKRDVRIVSSISRNNERNRLAIDRSIFSCLSIELTFPSHIVTDAR